MIITCVFDTLEKTLTVTADGQDIPDVKQACFYGGMAEDEFDCELTTMKKDETNDVRTVTRLMAHNWSPSRCITNWRTFSLNDPHLPG